ncbi:MAG: hypothetical protein ACI9R3_005368 [Verrucomicrobiales bacterium]|jgi:hypothetical protein
MIAGRVSEPPPSSSARPMNPPLDFKVPTNKASPPALWASDSTYTFFSVDGRVPLPDHCPSGQVTRS